MGTELGGETARKASFLRRAGRPKPLDVIDNCLGFVLPFQVRPNLTKLRSHLRSLLHTTGKFHLQLGSVLSHPGRKLEALGVVMLDRSRSWSNSLDQHYHDQSHFNRDFKRFMGLTPSAYMAQPHPIIDAAVRGRMAAAGAPMQVLHQPNSVRV